MPAPLISSRANPRVKQLRAAFAGHARLSGGLVAIEGEHLLFEAKRSGLAFKTIFLSERASPPEWLPRSVELIHLTDEVFASVVDTQSPQGIAALLVPPLWQIESAFPSASRPPAPQSSAPHPSQLHRDEQAPATQPNPVPHSSQSHRDEWDPTSTSPRPTAPLLLIAAGLQDPGNLGTLIRSAEAFAASAVLTTPGTVSPWNQKALRASAGSVFRIPVISSTLDDLTALKSRGLHLYAAAPADPNSTSLSLTEADLAQPCALMIGNEGSGLPPDLLHLADTRLSIPTPGPVESLNAAIAGSLLLYEASRQRTASDLPPTTGHSPLSQ